MITTITYNQFIERVQKFLANNWPDISNNITSNEMLMYVYGAFGTAIEMDAKQAYQMEGVYPSQDGFITTYSFAATSIAYDWDTGFYSLTLPFPPVNLPLGYSIKSPIFVGIGGESYPGIPMHAFQRGYALKMPTPDVGWFYRVEGDTMTISAPNVDLYNSGFTLKIPMLSPRSKTGTGTDLIQMPHAAMEVAFDIVVEKLMNRKRQPQNNVNQGVDRYTEKP